MTILAKDFFRIEGVPNQTEDKFYVREFIISAEPRNAHRYKWLYVTEDYPYSWTMKPGNARVFSHEEAEDFIGIIAYQSLELE